MATIDFAILGGGAIGSIVAAHLARAGHSVAVLARGRRAQQLQQIGLRIRGLTDFDVSVQVMTEPQQLRRAGTFILATKALHTRAALEPLGSTKVDVAFSLQNGVMKDDLLAEAFGAEQVLGSLANFSGELLDSGEVLFTRNVNLFVGELTDGSSQRAQQIAQIIDATGLRATMVTNMRAHEWSKFVAWIAMAVIACVTRAPTWKGLSDRGSALVLARLLGEMGTLAKSAGVELTDDSILPVATLCQSSEQEALSIILAIGQQYHNNAPQHRMSILQDLEAGRPLELDETIGFAANKARELGFALPLLSNAYELLGAMDRIRTST